MTQFRYTRSNHLFAHILNLIQLENVQNLKVLSFIVSILSHQSTTFLITTRIWMSQKEDTNCLEIENQHIYQDTCFRHKWVIE